MGSGPCSSEEAPAYHRQWEVHSSDAHGSIQSTRLTRSFVGGRGGLVWWQQPKPSDTRGGTLSAQLPPICSIMAGWPMIQRRKSRSSQQSKRRTPLNKHDDCCCSALLIWPIQWTGRTWCCGCCSCHSVRSSVICCSHSSRLY